jgi:acetyltransferase
MRIIRAAGGVRHTRKLPGPCYAAKTYVVPRYGQMATLPHAGELVGRHVLADGTGLVIRPIRPEDAVLEREFVDGLSERARYLRFMSPLRRISPQMLSRFTQIDYDREMALIALTENHGEQRQIAVARFVTYPDGRGCEFAVVVGDDWQGKGLATELLRRLIDIARERRLEYMEGLELRENRAMITFANELGFSQRPYEDDPQLVRVTLDL